MALARLIGSYDPYKDAEAALKTAPPSSPCAQICW